LSGLKETISERNDTTKRFTRQTKQIYLTLSFKNYVISILMVGLSSIFILHYNINFNMLHYSQFFSIQLCKSKRKKIQAKLNQNI